MLRKNASRMRVVSIYDLPARQAMAALRRMRKQNQLRQHPGVPVEEVPIEDNAILWKIYQAVGGRTSYLARATRAEDMLGAAKRFRGMRAHALQPRWR